MNLGTVRLELLNLAIGADVLEQATVRPELVEGHPIILSPVEGPELVEGSTLSLSKGGAAVDALAPDFRPSTSSGRCFDRLSMNGYEDARPHAWFLRAPSKPERIGAVGTRVHL